MIKPFRYNTVHYVTGNRGKYDMVHNYVLTHSALEIIHTPLSLLEEQQLDLQHIAIAKAAQAWHLVKEPVMVDDSGIYFDRYNHFPGFMTKFVYQALGAQGLFRLYDVGDRARFVTYLVIKGDEKHHQVYEGIVTGTLIKPDHLPENLLLPYTRLFVPDGSDQTLHELMNDTGYSDFNPRIRALQKLIQHQNTEIISVACV